MNYLKLGSLSSYRIALALSNKIWGTVVKWDYFGRQTVGVQIVRAVDSVSANIAEGFGRYHKKDKIKFYYYSFGSLKESCDWVLKARLRSLISKEEYDSIMVELDKLPKELNNLINFTRNKLKN